MMMALVDSFCLNCDAGVRAFGQRRLAAGRLGVRLVRLAAGGPLVAASSGMRHLLGSVLEDSRERSCLRHLHPVSSRRAASVGRRGALVSRCRGAYTR